MQHSSTLYELILATPEPQRVEAIEELPSGGRLRGLLEHLHSVVSSRGRYTHASGVRAVYGVAAGTPGYRKAYIAYLRLCHALEQRLQKRSSNEAVQEPIELTPSERLYYRARSLKTRGDAEGARSLLLAAHRRAHADGTDESMRLSIAALYLRCLLNDIGPWKEVLRSMPTLVSRSIVEALYHYGIYCGTLVRERSGKRFRDALDWYEHLATAPPLHDHEPVLQLMASWHRANHEELHGRRDSAAALRSKSTTLAEEALSHDYAFLRGSVEPTTGLEIRTLYSTAVTALDEDRLDDALALFALGADFSRSRHLRYEIQQTMRVRVLLSLGRLDEAAIEIEALHRYSVEQSMPMEVAKAEYLKGWHALYDRQKEPDEWIIQAMVKYQGYVEDKVDLLASVLITRSLYYFRRGDAKGIRAMLTQLRGRHCSPPGNRRDCTLQKAMLAVLEQRKEPTRRRASNINRMLRHLTTLLPGQHYRSGAIALWATRFLAVDSRSL